MLRRRFHHARGNVDHTDRVSDGLVPTRRSERLAAAGRFTLPDYAANVADALARQIEPVLLVGHSMAGMVITQVAEAHPEQIAGLVYLSAYLPENGRTLLSYAQVDAQSKLGPGLAVDEARALATISPDVMRAAFFNNTPAAEADAGVARLRPEPLQPFVFPVTTTAGRFGRVPRYYITTKRDAAVGPDLQQAMIAALPCARVYTFDTDHSSYVSMPRELSEMLVSIVSEVLPLHGR